MDEPGELKRLCELDMDAAGEDMLDAVTVDVGEGGATRVRVLSSRSSRGARDLQQTLSRPRWTRTAERCQKAHPKIWKLA
jgi:hypothetical protein